MPDELIHDLPMRWADLDELGHVNNVVYVDYALEARAAHVRAGDLPALEVASATVEFLRPLLLSERPVRVRSTMVADELVQEIAPVGAASPFARVTTRATAATLAARPDAGADYRLRVRGSDLGPDGAATLTRVFEYAQESRIAALRRLHEEHGAMGRFVVARVDVVLAEPFTWRAEPYRARTSITHVGRSSLTLGTDFEEGRLGRSDAVLVGFDLATQRSRVLEDAEREILSRGC